MTGIHELKSQREVKLPRGATFAVAAEGVVVREFFGATIGELSTLLDVLLIDEAPEETAPISVGEEA